MCALFHNNNNVIYLYLGKRELKARGRCEDRSNWLEHCV